MALGCLLAWTALRRNDGSGLGVAYACAVGHPRRLDRVLTVVKLRGWASHTLWQIFNGFKF